MKSQIQQQLCKNPDFDTGIEEMALWEREVAESRLDAFRQYLVCQTLLFGVTERDVVRGLGCVILRMEEYSNI